MQMKLMSSLALVGAFVVCVGCADSMGDNPPTTYPQDRPVGTTGSTPPQEPTQVQGARRGEIPVGQELDVRLQTPLSSATATPEQRFEATTVVDLEQGDAVLVPAGSKVRGVVSSVDKAGRVDR